MSQRGPGKNLGGGRGYRKDGDGDRRNDRPGGSRGPQNFSPAAQAGGSGKAKSIWTKAKLPHEMNLEGSSPGWKPLQNEEGLIVLPFKKDVAKEQMTTIPVKVNHFSIGIQFPQNIFSYKVGITKIRNNPEEVKPKPKGKKPNKRQGNEPENNPPGGEASAVQPLKKYITAEVMTALAAEIMRRHQIAVATDRVDILYSTKALEDKFNINIPFVLQVHIDGSGNDERETFSVEILKRIESIDTGVLQQLVDRSMQGQMPTPELIRIDQIYNILLKNIQNSRYTPIGRSALICFAGNGQSLGGGLVNYQGFDAVVGISGCWKPFLNIHFANCASVVNRNVIDVLAELFNERRENCLSISEDWGDDVKKATNLLRSCRVSYTPQPGMARGGVVTKLDHRPISAIMFPLQNPNGRETMISVYDYFVSRYNRRDLSRNGPALLLGKNYVPAELCTVKRGQSVNRGLTLSGQQTNQMLRHAKKEPTDLVRIVEGSIQELGLTNDRVLQEFGCTVPSNASLLTMDKTRVLAPPMICYGDNGNDPQQRMRVTPDSGQWDFAQLRAKFLTPSQPVKKWGILLTCPLMDFKTKTEINSQEATRTFKGLLMSKGRAAGLEFLTDPIIAMNRLEDRPGALVRNRETLKRLFEEKFVGCDFILVVIPAKKQCSIYTHVKQTAELPEVKTMALLTQCVSQESFTAFGAKLNTIVVNLLLKIHSKLGGINHVVCSPTDFASAFTIFQEPVMILGADVTHPPAGTYKEGEPAKSFAAVTCSINRTGMPYLMHVQAQEKAAAGAAEVITGFDGIIRNCLKQFEQRTQTRPTKIIYFRDGVGSGQFPELLQYEMGKIRGGCTQFQDGYEPAITFVTVQKRHKTRIFMKNPNGYQNPPPGTVVDTQIVHPTEHDFYLVSHYGALGTSRPSRYHVLWDDSDFSSDKLQQLTYYLCYMYVRCTKSVSIPAPTYYAHWAAKRAKILAEGTSDKGVVDVNRILFASKSLLAKYPMHFI